MESYLTFVVSMDLVRRPCDAQYDSRNGITAVLVFELLTDAQHCGIEASTNIASVNDATREVHSRDSDIHISNRELAVDLQANLNR